jgi:hypothetical protein
MRSHYEQPARAPDHDYPGVPQRGPGVHRDARVLPALFDYIEGGDPLDEFLDDFPDVSREHAIAVLELARITAVAEASKAAAE